MARGEDLWEGEREKWVNGAGVNKIRCETPLTLDGEVEGERVGGVAVRAGGDHSVLAHVLQCEVVDLQDCGVRSHSHGVLQSCQNTDRQTDDTQSEAVRSSQSQSLGIRYTH